MFLNQNSIYWINFADKVLDEFDKILQDEHKRLEKHFSKPLLRRKNSISGNSSIQRRKSVGEKNYVVWESNKNAWANNLRGSNNSVEKKIKNNVDNSSNVIDNVKW